MSSRNRKKRKEKRKETRKEGTSCVSLGIHDYRSILDYYNIPRHHETENNTQEKAQDVLRSKLCSCIKVQKQRTRKKRRILMNHAIAICNASVIAKQLRLKSFQCAKKNKIM